MDVRVAIYARVSSDRQAREGTIVSQVEALHERVRQDGHPVEDVRCFKDDGYSGTRLERPALDELRDAASAGEIDKVYVLTPDRLVRQHAYQVLLMDEFEKCNVELVFLNQLALADSPERMLLLQVQGVIAEYERAQILERSRRGKRSAARRGDLSVFSRAPYGYRYIPRAEAGGDGQFQVVPERARTVRQMFEWVALERASLTEVSRRLTRQRIASPSGQARWSRLTVLKILKNPAYMGTARFGRTRSGPPRRRLRLPRGQSQPSRHASSSRATDPSEQIPVAVTPLVSRELFDTVQEQLAENRRRCRMREGRPRFLLQGLTVCSCCGYAYSPKRSNRRSKPHEYYVCLGTESHRHGNQRLCENKLLRRDRLDDVVWRDACALLSDPQRLLAEYQRRLESPSNDASVKELQKRITQAQRHLNRVIDAYAEGLITKAELEIRTHRQRECLANLEAQLQAKRSEQVEHDQLRGLIGDFQQFASRVQDNLVNPDWETKRSILCVLVKQVEVSPENIRIVYRINPYPFSQAPARRGRLRHCLPCACLETRCPRRLL